MAKQKAKRLGREVKIAFKGCFDLTALSFDTIAQSGNLPFVHLPLQAMRQAKTQQNPSRTATRKLQYTQSKETEVEFAMSG